MREEKEGKVRGGRVRGSMGNDSKCERVVREGVGLTCTVLWVSSGVEVMAGGEK